MSKLDFDFPSNNPIVEDKPVSMVWLQWFQRVQKIIQRKTWQNVTTSRALGTTYTNGTGRSITISVRATSTLASALQVTLGSGLMLAGAGQASVGSGIWLMLEIPNGETYNVTVNAGVGTLQNWFELR